MNRKRFLKIMLIVLAIIVAVIVIAAIVMRSMLTARFVPKNLIDAAPDRISDTIQVDLSSSLQKQVTGGVIEGTTTETAGVQMYLGIPYAAPPVGGLRWRSAQGIPAWEGVRECKICGPNPIQGDNEVKPGAYGAEGVPDPSVGYSEDCLYLNVWTNGPVTEGMPVVFYIPGGAWVGGSNSVENYNGEYLASQGVVFVSVNYRLGIFGWLGSDVLEAEDSNGSTGNYGFTDILKALEWVQNNIAAFGGDPKNVTLYGGSAGGNLIDLLMVSPKAEGLFQRAVSMSYPIDMISPAWDKDFKKSHGNQVMPDAETLEKLRAMPVKDLYRVDGMLEAYAFSGPTIDGYYIDKTYAEAIAAGRGADIDYMTGFNYNDSFPGTGDAQFASMIAEATETVSEGDILRAMYDAVAAQRAKGGAGSTYLLQFEHPTPGPDESQGAVHGGDAQYMLHYFSPNRADWWTNADYRMGELASAYFINFCRTGNPNGTTAVGEPLPRWEASRDSASYFAMGPVCEMRKIDPERLSETQDYLTEKGHEFFD